jgi:hypothetical protein
VTQYFLGPMAKPHRMALLTGACLVSTFEGYIGLRGKTIALALIVMILGMIVTCARRTLRIVADLKKR